MNKKQTRIILMLAVLLPIGIFVIHSFTKIKKAQQDDMPSTFTLASEDLFPISDQETHRISVNEIFNSKILFLVKDRAEVLPEVTISNDTIFVREIFRKVAGKDLISPFPFEGYFYQFLVNDKDLNPKFRHL